MGAQGQRLRVWAGDECPALLVSVGVSGAIFGWGWPRHSPGGGGGGGQSAVRSLRVQPNAVQRAESPTGSFTKSGRPTDCCGAIVRLLHNSEGCVAAPTPVSAVLEAEPSLVGICL